MDYGRDIDHSMDFNCDYTEHEPFRIRNAFIVDGMVKQATEALASSDNVTAWAAAVKSQLHHEHQLYPVSDSRDEEVL